ncbi:MAG: protein kinase [Terriglobales bacterium]
MSLVTGTKLGPYEIVSSLGAGGMGEVYRARDTRLGRDVAVKVLPVAFSADPDRLRRFEQEARVLSALSHPNLLAIYDVGSQDGVHFLVSELLEGASLRQRLNEGSVSPRKAVDYAVQTANGLGAAHEKRIIHRDLKPDNIFITEDGRVKVLDFGLAKQTGETSESTATIGLLGTEPGMVLGTIGYMSPEQVRGKPTDARSDIFSFGAILYEIVAGQRAFQGESAVETMNAILKAEPAEISQTTHSVPPAMDRLIRRCLEKAPEERFQSARDLAFALDAVAGTSTSTAQPAGEAVHRSRDWRWPVALVGSLALAAIVTWLWFRAQPVTNPEFQRLTFQRGAVQRARFTPDGQTVVYSASWAGATPEIYATRPGSNESHSLGVRQARVMGVSAGGDMAVLLHWQPLYYFSGRGTLARMPVDGGSVREVLNDVYDADISSDGKQFAVVLQTGRRERLEFPIGHVLYETDGGISHPRISPSGEWVAFDDHPLFGDDRGFVAVTDLHGNTRRLTAEWSTLQGLTWAKSGKEVWFAAGGDTGLRSLSAVSLAGKLRLLWRVPSNLNLFDLAADGRMLASLDNQQGQLFAGQSGQPDRDLSWLDWSIEPLLSSDGKTLFFTDVGQSSGTDYASYMRGTDGSPAVRLGPGAGSSISHDGKWVLSQLASHPNKLLLLPTGAGETRQLEISGLEVPVLESSWMLNDQGFYFRAAEPGRHPRTFRMPLDGRKPVPVTEEGYFGAVLSPDGHTLVVHGPEDRLFLYDLESGKPRPLPQSKPGERCLNFDASGHGVYLSSSIEFPSIVEHVDLSTGQRQVWKTIQPSDPAGAGSEFVSITPKGDVYVYSLLRILSDLYVVQGLR